MLTPRFCADAGSAAAGVVVAAGVDVTGAAAGTCALVALDKSRHAEAIAQGRRKVRVFGVIASVVVSGF
jgi:hypothetical protein